MTKSCPALKSDYCTGTSWKGRILVSNISLHHNKDKFPLYGKEPLVCASYVLFATLEGLVTHGHVCKSTSSVCYLHLYAYDIAIQSPRAYYIYCLGLVAQYCICPFQVFPWTLILVFKK